MLAFVYVIFRFEHYLSDAKIRWIIVYLGYQWLAILFGNTQIEIIGLFLIVQGYLYL